MNFGKYIANQLRKPSGFFGRHVTVNMLNRVNIPINSLAIEVLQLTSDDQVLEVGFGGGELIARMVDIVIRGKITGADFSRDVVAVCTKRFNSLIKDGRIQLHCANVNELPFDAEAFTKVCTVNTIYFWSDPIVALTQIHRVLKKEGMLVVCFSPRIVMEKRWAIQHGFTLYDPEEVSTLLTKIGFREVQLIIGKHRFGECIAAKGKK